MVNNIDKKVQYLKNLDVIICHRCGTCTIMVCRDCIVLAHSKAEGHELQELNEVKAEYMLTLEQLRIKVDQSIKERQEHLSCLRTELDTMDIVSEVR